MRQLTFGCDPEFFFATDDGSPLPVCGWLGGTKKEHVQLGSVAVHEDGCAAELTLPPTTDAAEMVRRVRYGIEEVMQYACERAKRSVHLIHSPYVLLTPEALAAAGELAVQFGCSPEYDSYSGGESCPPVTPESFRAGKQGAYRFAGGHIHLGYKEVAPTIPEYVVAMLCDAAVGLYLVAFGEKQGKRRQLYGSAGRFRPTPYGVEYRTPCNQWVYDSAARDGLLNGLQAVQEVLYAGEANVRAKWNSINWPSVRACIGAEDSRSASRILSEIF